MESISYWFGTDRVIDAVENGHSPSIRIQAGPDASTIWHTINKSELEQILDLIRNHSDNKDS